MAEQNDENLRLVFCQTNEYLRAADVKQLQITGAFLALISAVSVYATEHGFSKLAPSHHTVVVYLMLTLTGFAVFLTLRWYRAWKVHYMNTLQAYAKHWSISDDFCPYWMRPSKDVIDDTKRTRWSMDDIFLYLIWFLESILAGLSLLSLLEAEPIRLEAFRIYDSIALASSLVAGALAAIGLFWVYVRLFKQTRHLRSEG